MPIQTAPNGKAPSGKAPSGKDASRAAYATYGAGLFANGQWDMLGLVVPLFAGAVGLSVAEIGLIVAARGILPALLSIHGGILMDRFGAHRLLVRLAAAATALPLLYPVSGWLAPLQLPAE